MLGSAGELMAILTIDPKRLPSVITAATGNAAKSLAATNHIGIPVYAFDANGKPGLYDVADLDDASIQAWLQQIKDPLKRIKYRKQLLRIRTPAGTQ
jgi:hypothetical protein